MSRQIEQMWESIKYKYQTDQEEKESDEIYFLKLLARDHVQIESFYGWAKITNIVCLIFAFVFGVAGALFVPAVIWLTNKKATSQITVNPKYIYASVLGMILLEILAGLCIWVSCSLHRRMEHYHDILCNEEQFLLTVGIAAKAERGDQNLKGELYKRILESELRRREEIAALNKQKKS